MFPIRKWNDLKRGQRFSDKHQGLDLLVPVRTEVRAPFNGIMLFSHEEGNDVTTLILKSRNYRMNNVLYLITFFNIDKDKPFSIVPKGEILGYTTKLESGKPGLHISVSSCTFFRDNQTFIDPDKFNWED